MLPIRAAVTISIVVVLPWFAFGQGQEKKKTIAPTILVTVGRPNVWTMEQAHYLLEKNRAHDLGIAAADLGALDANEVVGLRIDALKTLFTAQAQYDQAAGAKNSAATSQYKVDAERYNRLRAQLDDLRGKQAAKDGELAAAQFKLDSLNAQKSPDPSKVAEQTAVVARLKAEKTALDDEYQSTSSSLGSEPTLNVTSTLPQDTGAPTVIGSNSTFDKLLSGIPSGTAGQPKIQASIKLDNYINLQYEIVAKQLTLLRDAVGPNKRVIFLELPQSIYATQKFKPYPDVQALWGHHVAQTWWQIDKIETAEPLEHADPLAAPPDAQEIDRLRSVCPKKFEGKVIKSPGECQPGVESFETFEKFVQDRDPFLKGSAAEGWILNWKFTSILTKAGEKPGANTQPGGCETQQAAYPCSSYALDLIPRQGGLNVADMHSVSRAYGFSGLFGLLSGFGAKARYERQHDQYSQFVQQEVFASAFGKGETRFGWTFGPLPGTKRLSPGLRTTYAVLVVPAHARTLTLSARGCGYRRRVVPVDPFQPEFVTNDEDCSDTRTFVIDIPSSREGFHVSRIFYKSVPAGQRTTLELIGDFTPQVGILINGSPLQKVVSIGQPMIEQTAFTVPDNAGDKDVKGVFELVGTNKLVITFSMPPSFVGTPQIAVVTPANGAVINNFKAWINKPADDVNLGDQTSLGAGTADAMFYPSLTITRMSPEFPNSAGPPSVMLQIFGQGFKKNPTHGESAKLLLNGKEFARTPEIQPDPVLGEFKIDDDTRIRVLFGRVESFPHWHVDFFPKDTPGVSSALDDPGPPLAAECALEPGGTGGKDSPYELRFKGTLLSNTFPPTSKDDNLVITSQALKSPGEWVVNATAGKSIKDAVIQLKGWDAHDFRFCGCQGASRVTACGAGKSAAVRTPKEGPKKEKSESNPKH